MFNEAGSAERHDPVTPDFAAEIGDVDLSQPLSTDDCAAIKAAFWKYAVLVFPAQEINSDQHVAFASQFGPMEPNINSYADEIKKERIDKRVSNVSNLDQDNEILPAQSRKRQSGLANRLWHTDSSFRHVPALTSLLYSRQIAPIGGHTQFADLRAAYDDLPARIQQRLDGKIAELMAHATQRQFIHTHRWRANDLVMWDNRCTMHRGTGYDERRWKRDMHRATVSDIGNTREAIRAEKRA